MPWVRGAHHVLGVKHLLRELGHCQSAVLLRAAGCQWSKACHEEVKTGERNQIHCNLPQIAVELTWETKAASTTAHCCTYKVVEITVGGRRQFQSPEANVIQGLVVQEETFIGVLDQLVEG
jgi:hypothetical protein